MRAFLLAVCIVNLVSVPSSEAVESDAPAVDPCSRFTPAHGSEFCVSGKSRKNKKAACAQATDAARVEAAARCGMHPGFKPRCKEVATEPGSTSKTDYIVCAKHCLYPCKVPPP